MTLDVIRAHDLLYAFRENISSRIDYLRPVEAYQLSTEQFESAYAKSEAVDRPQVCLIIIDYQDFQKAKTAALAATAIPNKQVISLIRQYADF